MLAPIHLKHNVLCGHELLSSGSALFFHLLMVVTEVLNISANTNIFKELSLLSR